MLTALSSSLNPSLIFPCIIEMNCLVHTATPVKEVLLINDNATDCYVNETPNMLNYNLASVQIIMPSPIISVNKHNPVC